MKTVIERPLFFVRRNWKKDPPKLLLSLLLVVMIAMSSTAEPEVATMGVGVAFAPIGGQGFSFRKFPESGFGYQCGTIFWKSGGDSYINVGGELMYLLRHTRLTAFYLPAGIGISYTSQMQYDPSLSYPNQEYRQRTTQVSGGAGIGFAARSESWEDIWFSLDLVMVVDGSDITPLPQVAIHYFFR